MTPTGVSLWMRNRWVEVKYFSSILMTIYFHRIFCVSIYEFGRVHGICAAGLLFGPRNERISCIVLLGCIYMNLLTSG